MIGRVRNPETLNSVLFYVHFEHLRFTLVQTVNQYEKYGPGRPPWAALLPKGCSLFNLSTPRMTASCAQLGRQSHGPQKTYGRMRFQPRGSGCPNTPRAALSRYLRRMLQSFREGMQCKRTI